MSIAGGLILGAVLVVGGVQITNPRGGDPAAIQAGGALFRERCADCHGDDAKGGQAPDLTRLWTTEGIDQRVFHTIKSGIPGSIMPPSSAPDLEVWAIVAYLRSIGSGIPEASTGNAAGGEQLFASRCSSCHRVNGRGGYLGPDLSRIAATQSNAVLTRAIREASGAFTQGFDPVTLVSRDGQTIRGTRKGEDAFSIQIMDTFGRLRGYLKTNLRSVVRDKESLMPDFGPDQLTDEELNDVLAFLSTLRVIAPSGQPAVKSAADR